MSHILLNIDALEARIHALTPMGFALAVNIREFTPQLYRTSYPQEWVRQYRLNRFALFDPAILWWRFHEGTIRWSDIQLRTEQKAGDFVFQRAAAFGLRFGGCASFQSPDGDGLKSLLFGARVDRELTDDELAELAEILKSVVLGMGPYAGLSEPERAALEDLARGMTHNEIADLRGVSPATIKKRIERARRLLGAKNAVQAVALAAKRGLILSDLLMPLNLNDLP